jgi:hypothetical protein
LHVFFYHVLSCEEECIKGYTKIIYNLFNFIIY